MRYSPSNFRGFASLGDTLVCAADIIGVGLAAGLDVGENGGISPVGVDTDTDLSRLEAYL
jgi:hypothetical protein